jgi:hypothetical protein
MCIDSLCCVMVVTEMVCPSRQVARCSSVGGYEGFGDDYPYYYYAAAGNGAGGKFFDSGGKSFDGNGAAAGSGTVAPIWLDEMDCNGHESGLMDCQSGTCILLYACTVHVHGNKGFVRKVHLCVRMYIMCMHT